MGRSDPLKPTASAVFKPNLAMMHGEQGTRDGCLHRRLFGDKEGYSGFPLQLFLAYQRCIRALVNVSRQPPRHFKSHRTNTTIDDQTPQPTCPLVTAFSDIATASPPHKSSSSQSPSSTPTISGKRVASAGSASVSSPSSGSLARDVNSALSTKTRMACGLGFSCASLWGFYCLFLF